MRIGVIVAMDKEFAQLQTLASDKKEQTVAGRTFVVGRIGENEIVMQKCGIGKVNAAVGASEMIAAFHPDLVISTDENGVTTDKHTLAATNNANPNLKWERTGMFNIGVDFGFFNSRLTGTIEYYDKRTSDLIYYYPVSTNRYPYGTMTANVGDISNRGESRGFRRVDSAGRRNHHLRRYRPTGPPTGKTPDRAIPDPRQGYHAAAGQEGHQRGI